MAVRQIITIDEGKCDGCGVCVFACAEGAIQVIDGKARLVSETYCDGLGACLGECPQDAIHMEEREAAEYDETAVENHLNRLNAASLPKASHPNPELQQIHTGQSCPGSAMRTFGVSATTAAMAVDSASGLQQQSQLRNWPVQLYLAPTQAPYFDKANLLIAADCVPFALANFHGQFLAGKTLLIGCSKLDNVELYLTKLTEIFAGNDIKSVEIAFMEVPCCFGLMQIVLRALQNAQKNIPVALVKIGLRGEILEKRNTL